MASFTDNPLQQFNPYVSQLPIDAMVKVGMQKQAQYEQGVTKIQNQIDQVAGLDVYKDVHKKYLQSKLDELGNNLKTVAAGDFSNFQLVNSVGGMTKQLSKDPIIQNAVNSTAVLRKGDTEQSTAEKEGKSSPSNDAFWQKQKSDWLNDGDVKSSFSRSYTPKFDIDKKVFDYLKEVHADSLTQDEDYIYTGPDGKQRINSTLLQKHMKEGLVPAKTRGMVSQIFDDPQVKQQLSIDGWYNYRGYTPEDLINKQQINIDSEKEKIYQQTPFLRAYSSLTSGDVKAKADATISYNYDKLKNLDSEFESTKNFILRDPESAKVAIYTNNKLQEYTNNLSWKKESLETKINPSFEVYAKQTELAISRARLSMENRKTNAEINHLTRENSHMDFEEKMALQKLEGKVDENGIPIGGGRWTPTPVDPNKLNESTYNNKLNEEIETNQQSLFDMANRIGIQIPGQTNKVKDAFVIDGATGKLVLNYNYLAGNISTTPELFLKSVEQQVRAAGEALSSGHQDGAISADNVPFVKNLYDRLVTTDQKIKAKQKIENDYNVAISKLGLTGNLSSHNLVLPETTYGNIVQSSKDDLQPSKPLITKLPSTNIQLSPSDQVNLELYLKGKNNVFPDEDYSKNAYEDLKNKFSSETLTRILDVYKKQTSHPDNITGLFSLIKLGYDNLEEVANNKLNQGNIYKSSSKIKQLINNDAFLGIIKQRNDAYVDLQRREMQPTYTFNTSTAKSRESINEEMSAELNRIILNGGGTSGDYKDLVSSLQNLKDNTNTNLYQVKKIDGKWMGEVVRNNGSTFETVGTFPLSEQFINSHRKELINERVEAFEHSTFNDRLNLNGGYSTVNDLNSDEANSTAINRQTITSKKTGNGGRYSIGWQLSAFDKDTYTPIMYIKDIKTGNIYKNIPLDYNIISKTPGLSKEDRYILQNKPSYYSPTALMEGLRSFTDDFLMGRNNPNDIIETLIKYNANNR